MTTLFKGQKARVITEGFDENSHYFKIDDIIEFTGETTRGMRKFVNNDGVVQYLQFNDYELIEE